MSRRAAIRLTPEEQGAFLQTTRKASLATRDHTKLGGRYADMVQQVPREELVGIDDLEVGMQLQEQDPNGQTFVVYVTEIHDDVVVVDANHPLAGVYLTFDIEIVDVRDATAEELSHGHIHGPGGHHD